MAPGTDPQLRHLHGLPFVRQAGIEGAGSEEVLRLGLGDGEATFRVLRSRSNIGRAGALSALGDAGATRTILFAPYVGPSGASVLEQGGLAYADEVGNLSLNIDDRFVATRKGSRPAPRHRPKGLRAAAYRVLFALLARPSLSDLSLRQVAEAAGTSPSAVRDLRVRLLNGGDAVEDGRTLRLVYPERQVDRWAAGYADLLRPRLHLGRFAVPTGGLGAVERVLEARFGLVLRGGRDAAHMVAGSAASGGGGPWVLHVNVQDGGRVPALPLTPRADGPLEILGVPGPTALDFSPSAVPRVVHPLLVYGELLARGDERSLEEAADLRHRFGESWGRP